MATQLHRTVIVPGPTGDIETLLWSSPEQSSGVRPPLAAVVCHPHPLFGGTMHNKVAYQAAKTLHRFGLPVARFNFRGVGRSGGTHDNGAGEVQDVGAVIDFLANEYPGVPLLVAGFSFGSWVGLRAGCADARVTQLIGLGLPVADADARDFSYLNACEKPKLLVTGEFDRFGPPHTLRSIVERFSASARQQTSIQIVRGADHFFTGHLDAVDRAISEWLQQMNPGLTVPDSV